MKITRRGTTYTATFNGISRSSNSLQCAMLSVYYAAYVQEVICA